MIGNNPRGHPRQAGRIADDSTTRAAGDPGTADLDSSLRAVPAAFYGRTAHGTSTGDSQADRHRQLAGCSAVAAALSGPGRPAGAVVVADPWRLLPRRPAPGSTAILAQLAFLRVQLMLADSGLVISIAAEYALLGKLLTSPAPSTPPGGSTRRLPARRQRTRGSQAGQPAAGLARRPGEPR
jgi:hypothetical protein